MKLHKRYAILAVSTLTLVTLYLILNGGGEKIDNIRIGDKIQDFLLRRGLILYKPQKCQPHDNIMFLKTQRCASSTVQNILYRWGDERNLSFVLPKTTVPYMGNPTPFKKEFALESADGVYNILANHARFSEKGLADIMSNNSIYITILRNPVTQYESVYEYDELRLRYRVNMTTFLNNSNYFREPVGARIAGRNSMIFDLGLDARHRKANDTEVTQWIKMLDRKFNLVLIKEHLPESLILLKDVMCWSIEDILYLKQNARPSKNRTISEHIQNAILNWNSVDARLYDHFNKTLWAKIEAYGILRMKRDVAELERKNKLLKTECVTNVLTSGDQRVWYPAGVNIESFVLNKNATNTVLCSRVTRPENEYLALLVKKQHKRNKRIRKFSKIRIPRERRKRVQQKYVL